MTTIRTRPYPLLAAGMITLAAVAAAGASADRAAHGGPALGPAQLGTATTLASGATPSTAGGVVTYAAAVRPAPGGGDAQHAASTSATLTQQVAYRMQVLDNRAASGTGGAAVSVRVMLLNAAGTNVSGPGITLTVTGVSPRPSPGTAPHGILTAVNLGLWPCYQLAIDTAGYPAGSYTVSFAADSDPTTHTAQFVVP